MQNCKFCSKEYDCGMKLGGHMTYCKLNPKRNQTIKKLSQATRQPLSGSHKESIKIKVVKRIADGTWHNSFARSRTHEYNNQKFDGRWELALAKWFDANHITYVRNKIKFPYFFEKEKRTYTPDFYLQHIDCFIEVKGWKTLKDEAKWRDFPHRLVVLSGTDLQNIGLDITVKKDWKYPSMAII